MMGTTTFVNPQTIQTIVPALNLPIHAETPIASMSCSSPRCFAVTFANNSPEMLPSGPPASWQTIFLDSYLPRNQLDGSARWTNLRSSESLSYLLTVLTINLRCGYHVNPHAAASFDGLSTSFSPGIARHTAAQTFQQHRKHSWTY